MIHLDTNFLIRALVRNSSEDTRLQEWIKTDEPLGMSVIAWAEFLCGPVDDTALSLASLIVKQRFDFTEDMAVLSARLFNGSGRRRGTMADCMIAATVIVAGTALATCNSNDFERFEEFGLTLV